jgi:signal transduction histidine kinase
VRAHPRAFDIAVAFTLFIVTLAVPHPDTVDGERTPAAAVAVAGCIALALLGRRMYPRLTVAVTATGSAIAILLADGRPVYTFAVAIAMYSLATRTDRRTTVTAFLATAAAFAAASAINPPNQRVAFAAELMAWIGIPAAVGDAVRSGRSYVAAIEDRAVRAEQAREEEAGRRVAEERLRIARELHDVVAHHVAVVSVQAGLAGHLIDTKPDAARDALHIAQQASASILDELGGILRVLRQPDESPPDAAPAPGLSRLDALIATYSDAGLDVNWSLTGQPRTISGTADLVAYRVMQEALTNSHKHGTGTATVAVTYTPSTVSLEIINAIANGAPIEPNLGYGLMGMRERAAAAGGTLQVGSPVPGRFRVSLTLPC